MQLNQTKKRAIQRQAFKVTSAFRGEVLTEEEVNKRVDHYLSDESESELKVEKKAKKEVEDVIRAVVEGMKEMWGL